MNRTPDVPPVAKRLVQVATLASTIGAALCCVSCAPDAEVADHAGKAIYQRYCYACHQAGIADAPKLGDKDAWAPRLAKPRAELVENVIRGMAPGMPPRAGCGSCTDEDLADAVDFMVRRAQ